MAADVMRVIACWSEIDQMKALLISRMLKSDQTAVISMYEAAISDSLKSKMLLSVADEILPRWQFLLIKAVERATHQHRKIRNRFAHWVWGRAKGDLDNCALLADPSALSRASIGGSFQLVDKSKVLVYTDRELSKISREALEVTSWYGLLFMCVGDTIEQARRELLNIPELLGAIEKASANESEMVKAQLRPPMDGEVPARGLYPQVDKYRDDLGLD